MKVIKCDVCGKAADNYYQLKFRKIEADKAGAAIAHDLCEKCFRNAVKAIAGDKDVSFMS